MQEPLSLKQLNMAVGAAVNRLFADGAWVVAEINSLQDRGHCYLELIEKDPDTDTIIAKASATIWRNVYVALRIKFFKAVSSQLSAGMKVLVLVRPTLHPQYGYSLNIIDIEPSFTMGDAAIRRAAVVKKLKEDGVYDLNRQLQTPLLIKRIAVISTQSAAGYGDFMNQLASNPYGYTYSITLFESTMQGENAEQSIISALDEVAAASEKFDVVVIVRGGGAVSDLSCYDRYGVASCVAQFPIPVVTGIGHDRDVSVVDEVACVHLKTPTAVAAFIIDSTLAAHQRLSNVLQQFSDAVTLYVKEHQQKLDALAGSIATSAAICLERQKNRVQLLSADLALSVQAYIAAHEHKLDIAWQIIELTSPVNVLKKGYSMTLKNGTPVASATALKPDDVIETVFADGTVKSVVETC